MAEGNRRLWLILGVAGTGKTTMGHRRSASQRRLLLIDTTGDEYAHGRYVRIAGYDNLRAYLRRNWQGAFRIAYVPDTRDLDGEINRVAALAYAVGDVTLFVDELDLYCTAQRCPEKLRMLAIQGRHRNVSMIGVAREPQNVPVAIRSQATDLVCFRYFDPRALDWFRQAGCEGAERVRDLRGHDYLHWNCGELVGAEA